MSANAVSKTVKIIDKTSTIRTVTLYDNKENFSDYDGGDYITFHDGTAFRYAYCSSILYTNSEGNPSSYLICNFIDKDGNIRYMYTRQPDETEVLYKTITSNVSGATLMPAADNIWGCKIYLVNTKGSDGKNGGSGGSGAVTSTDKYNKPTGGTEGSPGAGGRGGSPGKSVYTTLSVGGLSLNMTLEGMCGAGGGGGGGAGWYNSSGATPGGAGGFGGAATNVSKSRSATIKNNNEITGNISFSYNSAYSGKNGFAGQRGYYTDNDGGMGGASGDGNTGWPGGDGKPEHGGYGGKGGDAGSAINGSSSGRAVGTKATVGASVFDSSSNSFTSTVASTGGVVITKIIASFPS